MSEPTTNKFSRRFDQNNMHWANSPVENRLFLQTMQGWANDTLRARGYIFLNDIQAMLGFDRTSDGQLVGWLRDGNGDGYVDFDITEVEGEPGSFILNFNPDGVVYDKI